MATGRHSIGAPVPALKGFRRRWPRRVLIGTNVVVAVVLALTGAAYGYVQFQFSKITHVTIGDIIHEGTGTQSHAAAGSSIPPFTLLAVGSDTRAIPGGSQFQGTGAAATAGARSDSIILIRVNPVDKAIALLSIPRDSLVKIPGMGVTRVNSAFNQATPNLLIQVLQEDFGIEVNHYAEANFDTFQQLANAVGGVNIWFPAAGKDPESLFNVGPGCNNLTGSLALAFVRSRNYFYKNANGYFELQQNPESDLARIQRQQAFIKLALQKARKIAPTNLPELNNLVTSLTSNLTLDSTFSNSELIQLADTFRSANLGDIPQYTYPTSNSTEVDGAVDPDFSAGATVVNQWLDVGQPVPSPTAPTTTPAVSAAPTTLVAPSSVEVEVANGSGIAGQAAKASADLTSVGYRVTVTNQRYPATVGSTLVLYAPDAKADATQVQSELVGGATIQEDAALTQSPYNLEVVTGSGYNGVSASATSGRTTTTTVAPETTTTEPSAAPGSTVVTPGSSSYVAGQYVPPGLEPGQKVVTCPN